MLSTSSLCTAPLFKQANMHVRTMDILKMQPLTFVLIGIILIFNAIFEGLELESVKMFYVFIPLLFQLSCLHTLISER